MTAVLFLTLMFGYIQDRRTGHLVGTGPRRRDSQRLWELDWLHLPSAASVSPVSSACAASSTSSFAQWHHRLGHLSDPPIIYFASLRSFRTSFKSSL
jgi:hypothetical protein